MDKENFWIDSADFHKCKEKISFSKGLNIVTGDYNSNVHMNASYLSGIDEDNEICIWSDRYAHSMHPAQLKLEVGSIIEDVSSGRQAIVFTDSLFMMRQLYILAYANKMPIRYINVYRDKDEFKVEQSDNIDDISRLSILDENLEQADKYLRLP